jgi:hypothetical protein
MHWFEKHTSWRQGIWSAINRTTLRDPKHYFHYYCALA